MPLELVQIRRRVQMRLADVKRAAAVRREKADAAERAYETFLAERRRRRPSAPSPRASRPKATRTGSRRPAARCA